MAQTRKTYLDVMKFSAICCVVLCHCMPKYIENYSANVIYNFIWLFQMPAFFFVSGFLHVKKEKISTTKSMWKYILKRLRTYCIPIITFFIFDSLINGNYCSIQEYFSVVTSKMIKWPFDITISLWFLFVLAIFSISSLFITYIVARMNKIIDKIIFVIFSLLFFELMFGVLFAFFGGDFLGSKYIMYYSIFFLLGYFTEFINSFFENKNKKLKNIRIFVCIITGLISLLICIFVKDIANFSDTNILHLFIRVAGSITIVLFVYLLLKIILKDKKNIISTLGQYTLEVYYIHIFVNRIIILPGASPNYYESTFSQWKITLLAFIIILACSYIINFVIQYVPYLHYIIFGTKGNKLSLFNRKEVEQCKN